MLRWLVGFTKMAGRCVRKMKNTEKVIIHTLVKSHGHCIVSKLDV